MASVTETSHIVRIGEAAGEVWRLLDQHGKLSVTRLVKLSGEPRDTVMQALGWLAREDKIQIDEDARSKVVSLK